MKSKKKELIIIVSIAAVAIVLGLIYAILKPIVGDDVSEVSKEEDVFVYPNITRDDVESIKVTNEYGEFEVYRLSDDNLYFKDAEPVAYSSEMFSAFIVNSTYMISNREVEDVTDYSLYGLDLEKDNPPYFEVNTIDGDYHKIYIGTQTPDGIGYYVKYYNKDTIYVVDSSIAYTHLCKVNDYFLPYVTTQISSATDYVNINEFYLSRRENDDDEDLTRLIKIRTKTDEEKGESTYFPYLIEYPKTEYNASTETFSEIQMTLASMTGTEVVDFGVYATTDTEGEEYEAYMARLAQWGLDKPKYELLYSYNDDRYLITFSKPDEDGNLYAYSMLQTTIVKIPLEDVEFLDYELIDFVDDAIYSRNINTVSKIETTIDDKTYTYTLTLNEDKSNVAKVYADGKEYDLDSFRQYYITMLNFDIIGYIDPPEEGTEPILTFKVYSTDGEFEYKFYRITSRKCFFTINGEGEFYVNYDVVKKMIDQTYAIENNEILPDEY